MLIGPGSQGVLLVGASILGVQTAGGIRAAQNIVRLYRGDFLSHAAHLFPPLDQSNPVIATSAVVPALVAIGLSLIVVPEFGATGVMFSLVAAQLTGLVFLIAAARKKS